MVHIVRVWIQATLEVVLSPRSDFFKHTQHLGSIVGESLAQLYEGDRVDSPGDGSRYTAKCTGPIQFVWSRVFITHLHMVGGRDKALFRLLRVHDLFTLHRGDCTIVVVDLHGAGRTIHLIVRHDEEGRMRKQTSGRREGKGEEGVEGERREKQRKVGRGRPYITSLMRGKFTTVEIPIGLGCSVLAKTFSRRGVSEESPYFVHTPDISRNQTPTILNEGKCPWPWVDKAEL